MIDNGVSLETSAPSQRGVAGLDERSMRVLELALAGFALAGALLLSLIR